MAQISPTLPTVGGDTDAWGTRNNAVHSAVIAQVNQHDSSIATLQSQVAALSGGGSSGVTVVDKGDYVTITF